MNGLVHRLGAFCVAHARVVLVAWVVAAIAVVAIGRAAGSDTNDNLKLPGTGSTRALDLLDERIPSRANQANPVVLEAASGSISAGANADVVKRTVRSLENEPDVAQAVSPLSAEGGQAVSRDRRIAYVSVILRESPSELTEEEADDVIAAADPARHAGFHVAVGGYLGQEVSKPETGASDKIGLGAAVVILLFAFGTVVAMGLPIATAVVGLATALSLIALLSHVVDVPTVGPTLATMIGLGVGIDYALFIVTRHRAQLREGMAPGESIAQAIGTSGKAVAFAGSTVVIALLSLLLADIPIVSALGYSAAIAVVVAVLAALTLLPALLGLLGTRIDSLRVPFLHSRAADDSQPHGWRRVATWISHRPWFAMVTSLAVLLVLTVPALDLTLGQPDNGQLPRDTESRRAYDLLNRGFGPGVTGPLLVAVEFAKPAHPDEKKLDKARAQGRELAQEKSGLEAQLQQAQGAEAEGLATPATVSQLESQIAQIEAAQRKLAQQERQLRAPASDPRLVRLERQIGKAAHVKTVSPAKVNGEGSAAVFTVVPAQDPASQATKDLVGNLRDDVIPDATAGEGLRAYVGGQTAAYVDLAARITDKLPSVIAIVVALSCILLLLAFRSILVPLKAAAMNLLSVGAAYGVLTYVFEEGHGASLIGLDGPTPIVSFVPLLMFAILFGLSMDYEVFLLSQVQDHYRRSGDNRGSVIEGLAATGKVITSAALIMVCVFSSFLLNGDPTVKQFGLGLAVAIAVDATIVRCMLVPAVMVLMGKSNWWLPRWLDRRLPNIGIEG